MHERTQRQVCRVVYVLACIVPTVFTLAFVLYFHRPWQERDWQQRLENNLHVRASISQIKAPRPGERELLNVRLADLSSNAKIASVDKLQLLSQNSLQAERIEVAIDDLEILTRTVQSWFGWDELSAVEFRIERLLLSHSPDETCELSNVRISFDDMLTQKRKLKIQGEMSTAEVNQATVRMQIELAPNGIWNISLDCRAGQIPVCFFTDFLPGAARWNGARFSGVMQLRCSNKVANGTLEGTISPLALQAWIGEDSPHKVLSTASLQFDKLLWTNHRITEAHGSLKSEPGQMNHSLLAALANSPYCELAKNFNGSSSPETISFEKFACSFHMSADGLTVTGNCLSPKPDMPGCLLVSDGEPLLVQPTIHNVPLPYFVQIFCPLDKYWLPGMRKAVDLAKVLPMPDQEKIKK